MTKIQWLNNGCYPGSVLFSFGNSYNEIMDQLKKKRYSDWRIGISDDRDLIESGEYFALMRQIENLKTGDLKSLFYIIITDEFTFTDMEYCKLAHEVLHICQFFLPKLFDRDREYEAEAYYHTHIMRQCLEALRKE